MKLTLVASLGVVLLLGIGANAATGVLAWAPLTTQEQTNLSTELRGTSGKIMIACAGDYCRALADGVAGIFARAGWQVSRVNHGGLGISGIVGMRADSCGIGAAKLRAAIEKATPRKIEVVGDGPCDAKWINGDRPSLW